jgi:hypothetical protein
MIRKSAKRFSEEITPKQGMIRKSAKRFSEEITPKQGMIRKSAKRFSGATNAWHLRGDHAQTRNASGKADECPKIGSAQILGESVLRFWRS